MLIQIFILAGWKHDRDQREVQKKEKIGAVGRSLIRRLLSAIYYFCLTVTVSAFDKIEK